MTDARVTLSLDIDFYVIIKYEADSAPALAIEKSIEQTKKRFAMYGKQGLLCGADGLPHLVTTGDWKHAGEFTVRV